MNEVRALELASAVAVAWRRVGATRTQAGDAFADLPCRSADPELFFAESAARVEQAKAICRTCPVRRACLLGALERREPWGVWGGEVLAKGKVIPVKRGRGRPPKIHPVPTASRQAA